MSPRTSQSTLSGSCQQTDGFQSIGDTPTQYLYCFDSEWVPGMAGTAINPLDPALGIAWPLPVDVADPAQISAKDLNAPPLHA